MLPPAGEQVDWHCLHAGELKRLVTFITLLPTRTTVNLNTAPLEVLAAVINGLDVGSAERLVQSRQRDPFKEVQNARALLPAGVEMKDELVGINSEYFEVQGQVRLGDRVLQERSLVHR